MRLIVGITGCSGVIYGIRFLEACQNLDIETNLILSPAAKKIVNYELEGNPENLREKATKVYDYEELSAPISSGSNSNDGMVIIPCSMKTLGAIAGGISDNLINRSADVALKENRPLILVPRETPYNLIHIENMAKLKRAGTIVLPATPGFYHDPQSIDDMIDFIVGKTLDQLDVEHELYESWSGPGGEE